MVTWHALTALVSAPLILMDYFTIICGVYPSKHVLKWSEIKDRSVSTWREIENRKERPQVSSRAQLQQCAYCQKYIAEASSWIRSAPSTGNAHQPECLRETEESNTLRLSHACFIISLACIQSHVHASFFLFIHHYMGKPSGTERWEKGNRERLHSARVVSECF